MSSTCKCAPTLVLVIAFTLLLGASPLLVRASYKDAEPSYNVLTVGVLDELCKLLFSFGVIHLFRTEAERVEVNVSETRAGARCCNSRMVPVERSEFTPFTFPFYRALFFEDAMPYSVPALICTFSAST